MNYRLCLTRFNDFAEHEPSPGSRGLPFRQLPYWSSWVFMDFKNQNPFACKKLQHSVSSLLQCFYRLLQSLSLLLRVTKSGQMQSTFHSSRSLHTAWVFLGNGLKEMADWGGIKNTSIPKITKVHQRVNADVLYPSLSHKYLEYLAKQFPSFGAFPSTAW